MHAGDAIGMEYVEHKFCGIFNLMDKHKYVEIVLNQIEKKFLESSYGTLQEIRINSSCKYKIDNKDGSSFYPMHVLDEVMENVNMWVKALPVNQAEESWTIHSPNVTLARRSILFEHSEYKRGLLDFEKLLYQDKIEEKTLILISMLFQENKPKNSCF